MAAHVRDTAFANANVDASGMATETDPLIAEVCVVPASLLGLLTAPPGWHQWRAVLVIGLGVLSVIATWIMQPVFVNPLLQADSPAFTKAVLGLLSSLQFLSWGIGATVFSTLADRLGRKAVLRWTIPAAAIASILAAAPLPAALPASVLGLDPLVLQQAASRLGLGLFIGGTAPAYPLLMECVPAGWRSPLTVLIACTWAGFACLAAGAAYLLRAQGWRLLLLVFAAPNLLAWLALGALIPESALQRADAGRPGAAAGIVRRACADNGRPLPPGVAEEAALAAATAATQVKASAGGGGFGQLLSAPLWRTTVALCFCWFSVTLVYYGLSFAVGSLVGGLYFDSAILSLSDIPGNLGWLVLADHPRVGRRGAMIGFFLLSGTCLAGLPLLPLLGYKEGWRQQALAVVGKIGAAAAFNGVYVLSAECFPTSVRATALGCCNLFARAGGVLAPILAELGLDAIALSFCALSAAAAALTWCWLPETLGRSL
jgi:MFS family permease